MPQPRIEAFLLPNHVERRAHILTESDKYVTQSSVGIIPHAEVLGSCLPDYGEFGLVMWVDFIQHSRIGETIDTAKPTVASQRIGDVAVAVGERAFMRPEEIIEEGTTAYLEAWLDRYLANKKRNSFGDREHPIIEPIYSLRKFIKGEL